VIANQRRSRRRRFALHERLALEAASVPHEPPPADREETLVHEALRRLGPRDREVLLLAEWEGLSPAQIAAVLGCLTVTARGRLHRARRRFRALFDPDSGTTPDEYLAAVREDVGGVTLRRIIGAMSGLTTSRRADGSTVYRGTVAAGQIARESGFKEGQAIRVLPFGNVAHDEASNPAAPLDTAVTVGADGIVREIAVTWGTRASAWRYTVTYAEVGTTSALVAPENARSLEELRNLERAKHGSGG
jgi:Sigma-70, region 4